MDNIRLDLQEVGCGYVEWIGLAQDRDRWRTLVIAVMNLRVLIFINVFLARHVSGTYGHHQEHQTLSCSMWFSAPSFWMGVGLESRCVSFVSLSLIFDYDRPYSDSMAFQACFSQVQSNEII